MRTYSSNHGARFTISVLAGFMWLLTVAVADAEGPQTVRLLTIGNSFSRNATHFLGDLATSGGHKLIHRPIVVGGASLQLHAEKFQRHEIDSSDKAGCYTNGRSLKQELTADKWNFVTIQQASIKSHDITTYRPFAGQLHAFIRKHAPQAEVLMHQTWAYRCDDPRFKQKDPKPGEPLTQEEMYRGLKSAYETIAAELGVRRIPVGDAFYLADTDEKWRFLADGKFDFNLAKFPALPNQTHSLHTGWRWMKSKAGKQELKMDGHHANLAGEYLGACVFYEILFNESVIGNRFVPAGLPAKHARFLQETAHQAAEKVRSRQ